MVDPETSPRTRLSRPLARKKLQRAGLLPMKTHVTPGLPEEADRAQAPFLIWKNRARHLPLNSRPLRTRLGSVSTVEIYDKQDQGDAAEGRDVGKRGSRDPAARCFRRGHRGADQHRQEARLRHPRPD